MKELLDGLILRGLTTRDKVRVYWFAGALVLLCCSAETPLFGIVAIANLAAAAWQLKKVDTSRCEWLREEE